MTGKVLVYDSRTKSGTISGNNDERYTFSNDDWKNKIKPKEHQYVDFEIGENNQANNIYTSVEKTQNTSTTSGLAIASLILSILWLYWIGSILAIIFGHIARSNIKKSNGQITGSGIALAGLIIGYLSFGFILIGVLAAVAIPKFV